MNQSLVVKHVHVIPKREIAKIVFVSFAAKTAVGVAVKTAAKLIKSNA